MGVTCSGSSPRMRGTVPPADWVSIAFQSPVHPRACGEQGRAPGLPLVGVTCRFIPAHAGNSVGSECGDERIRATVHPRACGEQARQELEPNRCAARRFIPAHAGNSLFELLHGEARFIPGDRGTDWLRLAGGTTVHPRACGEQAFAVFRGQAYSHERFIPAHAGNSASGQ